MADSETLATLRTLRDGLTGRLQDCESNREFVVLSRTLMDVLTRIDVLDPPPPPVREETPLDEFSRKLVERRRADSKALGHGGVEAARGLRCEG